MLYSYSLKFSFTTDAGILSYLKNKEIKLKKIKFQWNDSNIKNV